MIVTKLLGGLGNQMFQYAAGRALAVARGDELYLDASAFERPQAGTPRSYQLNELRVLERFATSYTRWKFFAGGHLGRVWFRNYVYVQQRGRGFDRSLGEITTRHVYLDGYWQCEDYFSAARPLLLDELAVAGEPTPRNAELLSEIGACHAVAVHVRRGDYVLDERTSSHHGACDLAYYERAIQHVRARVHDARFYVFSDDHEWARTNLRIDGPVEYVGHNPPHRAAEDLRLMRACTHFVVANSSFSWWAAWLANSPEKIVVAPARWFADPMAEEGDIVPRSWIRL